MELKHTKTELKNVKENLNSRLSQTEQRISELSEESFVRREKRKNEKSGQTYRTSSSETVSVLWGSQKNERDEKRQKAYLKL